MNIDKLNELYNIETNKNIEITKLYINNKFSIKNIRNTNLKIKKKNIYKRFNNKNINYQDKYGYTKLMYACYFRDNILIKHLLRNKSIDVNIINYNNCPNNALSLYHTLPFMHIYNKKYDNNEIYNNRIYNDNNMKKLKINLKILKKLIKKTSKFINNIYNESIYMVLCYFHEYDLFRTLLERNNLEEQEKIVNNLSMIDGCSYNYNCLNYLISNDSTINSHQFQLFSYLLDKKSKINLYNLLYTSINISNNNLHINYMIEHACDDEINIKDKKNNSILNNIYDEFTVILLIKRGINIHTINNDGENYFLKSCKNCLVFCGMYDFEIIIKYLIPLNININIIDNDGYNALYYICLYGSIHMLNIMINYGINLNIVTIHGTILDYVNYFQILSYKFIKIILDNNMNINLCTKKTFNFVLMTICENNNIDLLEKILDINVKFKINNKILTSILENNKINNNIKNEVKKIKSNTKSASKINNN